MIRTSTVVYVILLLVLVGAYFYLRTRSEQPADIELTVEPGAEVSYLFSAEQGTPSRIRIEANTGETVELARDTSNAWVLTQPGEATANQAAAEAAATQVTSMSILDTVPDVDPGVVGLDNPAYILTVELGSTAQTVEVGLLTPTESGYYVRDPAGQVIIVSRNAIDALVGLLENPPYLETPTPVPNTNTLQAVTPAAATATP
jgi:hypothetical protein